jgi:Arc/MetJ family transcription regulator
MILDETLLEEARRLTGVTEKTALVHEGLRALIAREHSARLRRLAGSDPTASVGDRSRRRPRP